jgi:hypothetical protein
LSGRPGPPTVRDHQRTARERKRQPAGVEPDLYSKFRYGGELAGAGPTPPRLQARVFAASRPTRTALKSLSGPSLQDALAEQVALFNELIAPKTP